MDYSFMEGGKGHAQLHLQVSVAGALSSIAAYAAKRDYKLHTLDAEQAPAVPKGPWVLDQVCMTKALPSMHSPYVKRASCCSRDQIAGT